MMKFLLQLKSKNKLLFFFGCLLWICGLFCAIMMQVDKTQILGINAWIKPLKFCISFAIMSWTMGWLLQYLEKQKAVNLYSWLFILMMSIEQLIITFQAARGQRSHFNVDTALNASLYGIMGSAIALFTLGTAAICFLFFRQKKFKISDPYLWGIRLGLLLFVIFASEGAIMVVRMSHTIGGIDGSPGLPFVNWSEKFGDLRVAHFLGMHALQILPLYGYFLARTKKETIVFSLLYLLACVSLLIMAFKGLALIST